jgi:glutamate formiminotransferase/formiminotetrahydrofolate cyclodeaminase
LVDGRAQVSMNLTNFHQTPIARVVETVRREAARYGVVIHHSELVGLIPQEALVDAAVWYTQLDEFKPNQILESRLYEVMQPAGEASKKEDISFLDDLASADPTPGGGSAAAYTGAEAAALIAMVGRVTIGKKKYADVEQEMISMIDQADDLRKKLTAAVKEDAASFERLITAIRLPKTTTEEQSIRTIVIDEATKEAARVPHTTARMCLATIELALKAAELGNINAISDAASAAFLAVAGLKSASANVKINVKSLMNPVEMNNLIVDVIEFTKRATELETQLQQVLSDRADIH